MAHLDAILVWYVEGLGTSSGIRAFSDRTMTSALIGDMTVDTNVVAIRNTPNIGAVQVSPLQTKSSDAGYSITFGRHAGTLALLNVDNDPYQSQGDAVRIAASLTRATTSFDVTEDTPISASDVIWIGGEAMTVVSKTGGDNITVTRGALRTRTQFHPLTEPPKVIFDGMPSLEGRFCTLLRGPADAEAETELDILFKGQIKKVKEDGKGNIVIDVSSQYEVIAKQKWIVPQRGIEPAPTVLAFGTLRGIHRDADGRLHVGTIFVDETYNNYDTWEYLRFHYDGRWIIAKATAGTASTISGRSIRFLTVADERPVAMGKDQDIYPRDRWDEILPKESTKQVNIEYALVLVSDSDRGIGAFVEAVLTGQSRSGSFFLPPSLSLNLQTSEIRSTMYDRIDDALGWGILSNSQGSQPAFVTPMFEGSILDVLQTEILGPLGLAFVFQDGVIDVIDWRETRVTVATINDSELNVADFNRDRDSSRVLRSVTLETPSNKHQISSQVANAFDLGGLDLKFKMGLLSQFMDAVTDRWMHQLMIANERRVFVLTLTIRDVPNNDNGDPLRVGDTVKLVLDNIPEKDGTLGITNKAALITSISFNGQDRSRTLTLIVRDNLTGLALWTPCANCTGNVSGSTTIDISANEFTSSTRNLGPSNDAAAFTDFAASGTGVKLYLLDEFGTRRDSNAPELTGTLTNKLVIDAAFDNGGALTINADDIIVVADYDTNPSGQQTSELGFLADDSGLLGAANDGGRVWA